MEIPEWLTKVSEEAPNINQEQDKVDFVVNTLVKEFKERFPDWKTMVNNNRANLGREVFPGDVLTPEKTRDFWAGKFIYLFKAFWEADKFPRVTVDEYIEIPDKYIEGCLEKTLYKELPEVKKESSLNKKASKKTKSSPRELGAMAAQRKIKE